MNDQPIEKYERSDDGTLDIHSIFYTIQGEGPFCGHPAIFIRLAGCNLQCPGCDTDYTDGRKRKHLNVINEEVRDLCRDEYPDAPKPLIVVTGGEPFRQDIAALCNGLITAGHSVQVETNGTLPPPRNLNEHVAIVVSPKTGKINENIRHRITALKYVVQAGAVLPRDGLPSRALEHTCSPCVAKPPLDYKGPVYIQPMDEGNVSKNKRNLAEAVDSCMKNGYTLQVQMHKVIGVE